jgi:SpoVK/Ycf46/Vps4 family AAA+-type ATPase
MQEWVSKSKFTKVHTKDYVTKGEFFSTLVYEMESEGGVLLLTVQDYLVDFPKNKAKIGKNEIYVSLTGNIAESIYKEVTDSIVALTTSKKQEANNVALVIQTQRGYDTQTFELPKQKLDIDLNYGKDFKPVHDKIIKQLNEPNGKGLVLLHGVPGGGKTHYLKYLASKIKDKQVLFIPPYLADFITSPEMTPFLIQNSNSVLFIEDAENVITDRNINGSNGVSNILNITDGILSDILKIQVVATFNMDKAKIDSALLRKGRLIAEHKFDALPTDDANALLKHLGKEENATKPMTLTEIYNVDEEEFKSEDGKPKIGFGR